MEVGTSDVELCAHLLVCYLFTVKTCRKLEHSTWYALGWHVSLRLTNAASVAASTVTNNRPV
jgi:hypothetical protein